MFSKILEGYSDASWISSVGDNLFIIGWVFCLKEERFLRAQRNKHILHSNSENGFITLPKNGKEAKWLRDFMRNFPMVINKSH